MDNKQKSREYWEKRARENENKVYKQGTDLMKELNSSYTRARREIQKSINDLVARYMDKTELSYAEAMKYLTSSEFKEWRMTLEDYEEHIELLEDVSPELAKKVRIELETLAMKSRITRLDSLKTQIDFELNKKTIAEQDLIEKGVSAAYTDFYKIQTTEFGLTGVHTILPKATLERLMQQPWSGENFSERIWGNAEALGKVLKQEIIQSFMQGISVKDLSDRIEKRFITDRKNTERLVRTELNHALNETTRLSYEEAEIEEYEYLAEIDGRTSDICRELNGQKFKMKDAKAGVNYPPMHPHCRSTTVPVIDYENFGKKKDTTKKIEEPKKKDKENVKNDKIEEKAINNCKTVQDVENLMKSQKWFYVVKENNFDSNEELKLEGCDLEAAKQVYIAFEEVYNKFPQLKGKLASVRAYNFKNNMVFAECQGGFGVGGIGLNTQKYKSYKILEKEYKEDIKAGFHPKGTDWTAILTHEFGHAIDDYLSFGLKLAGEKSGKVKRMSSVMRTKVLKKVGLKTGDTRSIEQQVSEYATKNAAEFFAECFAEYMKSENPRQVATEFGKQLEEILKEIK